MGHRGELRVDQAHRGYEAANDTDGYASPNPLYMRYSPDPAGFFAAQRCYGYLSLEAWASACVRINEGGATATDYEGTLPTLAGTVWVTAVLEAGRASLDSGGQPVDLPEDPLAEPVAARA
jgi:D-galacturonate reductase